MLLKLKRFFIFAKYNIEIKLLNLNKLKHYITFPFIPIDVNLDKEIDLYFESIPIKTKKVYVNLNNILNYLGFEKCEFGPDVNDICDKCHCNNTQLYYRRTDYFVDEGEYYCETCVRNQYDIMKLEEEKLCLKT